MRKLFMILLVPISLLGQNLKIESKEIIWQKIYQDSISADAFYELMRKSGDFSNMEIYNNIITANFNETEYKFEKNREGSLYMYTGKMVGFIQIDFKEDRYRVTVKKIGVKESANTSFTSKGDITPIEKYALNKNGTFRKGFEKRDIKPTERTIEKIINFNRNNDW